MEPKKEGCRLCKRRKRGERETQEVLKKKKIFVKGRKGAAQRKGLRANASNKAPFKKEDPLPLVENTRYPWQSMKN